MKIIVFILTLLTSHAVFADESPVRVLFIGNSLTFCPGTADDPALPTQFKNIATALGRSVEVEAVLTPGETLKRHIEVGKAAERIKHGKFNYVVIQSYSIEPLKLPKCFYAHGGPQGRKEFLEYGARLVKMVEEAGAIPVFFVQWTYHKAHHFFQPDFPCLKFAEDEENASEKWYGEDLDTYQRMLKEGYQLLATKASKSIISPVGDNWRSVLKDHDAVVTYKDLYHEDNRHPAFVGTYFNAMILAKDILSLDLKDLKTFPEPLDEAKFEYLKRKLED